MNPSFTLEAAQAKIQNYIEKRLPGAVVPRDILDLLAILPLEDRARYLEQMGLVVEDQQQGQNQELVDLVIDYLTSSVNGDFFQQWPTMLASLVADFHQPGVIPVSANQVRYWLGDNDFNFLVGIIKEKKLNNEQIQKLYRAINILGGYIQNLALSQCNKYKLDRKSGLLREIQETQSEIELIEGNVNYITGRCAQACISLNYNQIIDDIFANLFS